jgi:5'-3' exonuclease
MVEFEADDGLAAAATMAATDARVRRIFICTPDKDLAQCVSGSRIVQLDRRARVVRDEAGVTKKFGVPPASIPDYLALVGDSADGYPGLPGWGAKSAAAVLQAYPRVEDIPVRHEDWSVSVRGAARLGAALAEYRDQALLFKRLATLRTDAPAPESVDALLWRGPTDAFEAFANRLGSTSLWQRARAISAGRPQRASV